MYFFVSHAINSSLSIIAETVNGVESSASEAFHNPIRLTFIIVIHRNVVDLPEFRELAITHGLEKEIEIHLEEKREKREMIFYVFWSILQCKIAENSANVFHQYVQFHLHFFISLNRTKGQF